MYLKSLIAVVLIGFVTTAVYAQEHLYRDISARYPQQALDNKSVAHARMQGECLVGLKELNFKRKDKFDPIAEWSNYRSASLLEQYSPCEVLIMMEVAKSELQQQRQAEKAR